MSDLEISRVLELEHGLWLASFDGSDVPRLVFYDPATQLPIPLERSLQELINDVQLSNRWRTLILGWLESRHELPPNDLRVKVAEKAAVILCES